MRTDSRMTTLIKDSQGAIVFITALVFPVLLAFMGLSLDIGFIYDLKRRQQNAANAAAMGGAWEKWRRHTGRITAAAKYDARMNGFADKALTGGNPDVTVTVNPDYTHGGTSGYVEVEIEEIVQTYFMRVLGEETVTVRSRAVAGLEKYADACVIALDPDDGGALRLNGGATLDADCGIFVNSTANNALVVNGQPGCLLASSYSGIGVSGGFFNPSGTPCVSPDPVPNMPQIEDPLAYMTSYAPSTPAIADCDWTDRHVQTNSGDPPVYLSPGVYCSSLISTAVTDPNTGITTWETSYEATLKISGGGSVVFNAGFYVLASGMRITGSANVSGTGVTFYNTSLQEYSADPNSWQNFAIAGTTGANNVKFQVSAPDSGDYEGMLFWEDDAAPTFDGDGNKRRHFFGGNASSYMTGAIYAPNSELAWAGTNTSADWTMIVGNTIVVEGDALVPSGALNSSSIVPPTWKVTLVE